MSSLLMTSYQEKISDLTRTAKLGVNIIGFFIKVSEYIILSMGRCCIVFGENRNLLSMKNGGPRFAKCAYFSENSQFCSNFKNKIYFCNQHDRLIPKNIFFVFKYPILVLKIIPLV